MIDENNVKNVMVYGDSIISILPEGIQKEDYPTTWDEPLPEGTQIVGLTTTDGESFTKSVDVTDIDANQKPKVRQVASTGTATLEFTAMEDNEITRYLWEAVQPAPGQTYVDVEDLTNIVSRVLCYDASDTQQGYVKHVRYVGLATIVPNGKISYVTGTTASRPFLATFLSGYRRCFEDDES